MNRFWNILLAIILLMAQQVKLLSQETPGIITLTGTVIDSVNGKPVAYATINLLDKANNLLAAAYSKENGLLVISYSATGDFIVEISAVGYEAMQLPVAVKQGQTSFELGTLKLSPAVASLAEVTVSARRRLVEQKPGMLVYNAENDISNKGGTAADVLRKAPVLNVDAQGNVTMRGSSNLKILINGKYSGQMARSPADALNMIPADAVKSVEVITNPSAKYDAEGAAGVIYIITKKGRKDFNGTLDISGSNYQQMINPRISFGSDKWSFNIIGHLHRYRSKEFADLERQQNEAGQAVSTLSQQTVNDNTAPHASADLSLVFTPDSLNEFSFGMESWLGKWPDDNRNQTLLQLANGAVAEQYQQSVHQADHLLGANFNLGYERKFSQPGCSFTLLAQLAPARNKSAYELQQNGLGNELLYREINNGLTRNREWTFQADYIQPLSKSGKYYLESGLKLIKRNVRNEYAVQASGTQANLLEPQPLRSDVFTYAQNVYAAYSLLKLNFSSNWYAEGGLRLEKTKVRGSFAYNGDPFQNSFTNFIPTATVSKKISPAQSISFSYSKRLTRPFVWDLNPNADASDPKNITTGNPALNPEVANQLELAYSLTPGNRFFLNTALFIKHTNNAMIDFATVNSNGVSVTSRQNLASNSLYGLNISYFISVNSQVSINGNFNPGYLNYSSDALQVWNKGWAADADFNLTWKLPANYTMQAFGEYNSRKVTMQGNETGTWHYNLSFKKGVPAKKLTFTASFINPFSSYIPQKITLASGSFSSVLQNRYYSREFRLAVNWEFGSPFTAKESKKARNDDVSGRGNE